MVAKRGRRLGSRRDPRRSLPSRRRPSAQGTGVQQCGPPHARPDLRCRGDGSVEAITREVDHDVLLRCGRTAIVMAEAWHRAPRDWIGSVERCGSSLFHILNGLSPADRQVDLARLETAVRTLDADILALEEVDQNQANAPIVLTSPPWWPRPWAPMVHRSSTSLDGTPGRAGWWRSRGRPISVSRDHAAVALPRRGAGRCSGARASVRTSRFPVPGAAPPRCRSAKSHVLALDEARLHVWRIGPQAALPLRSGR